MKPLLSAGRCCLLLLPLAAAASGPSLSERYAAIAIQGDLRPAVGLFSDVGPLASEADRVLADAFRARFAEAGEPEPAPSGDPLVDHVIAAYQAYWRAALLGEGLGARPESELRASLGTVLQPGVTLGDDELYPALSAALETAGYRALVSDAPPLRDLFVWRRQDTRSFEVQLTDETRSVQVAFLSDFQSQGWKHYASLGLASTSGWVDGDTLYCVDWVYAPDSETFRVSYLKHETRHLADLERFPGLSSTELEYRAKLTELAFATATLPRLLDDFRAKAADNPGSPHAAANYRVMRDLGLALFGQAEVAANRWSAVSPGKVHRAARDLLAQDTGRLEGAR